MKRSGSPGSRSVLFGLGRAISWRSPLSEIDPPMENPGFTDERSELEQKLVKVIQDFMTELGMDRAARGVTLDASLERELGLASLERVELFLQVEKAFEVSLPDSAVAQARTPRELAQAILQGLRAGVPKPSIRLDRHLPIEKAGAPPTSAETLTETLLRHAETEPDRPHIYLQGNEPGEEQVITYRRLLDGAREVAAGLSGLGLVPGEAAAIMLPTGSDFFSAFFGVLLAGGVPVPLYPPYQADLIEEYARRQAAILEKAEARLLILSEEIRGLARILMSLAPSVRGTPTVNALRTSSARTDCLPLRKEDPALIQFTSGSTAAPKGVLLTHHNVLANIRSIGAAIEIRPTDFGVSWLPLYHDMGLIGSWLFSLYFGIPIAILSPVAFLSRPERWLWTIHYHQATLSAAPNFAYELCARKIDDHAVEGLDLSSWRLAFNGSESVLPETVARFSRRFAPYGFRPEAFFPVYGLAESSVALAFPAPGRSPRVDSVAREHFERKRVARPASASEPSPLRFVSCGGPLPGHQIRIVNDAGEEVADRTEGSLYFRGPSAMKGYYRDPKLTESVFKDGWWDSEDLAYRADGEIFITGRRKDLIIKAGRNFYPQEVEQIAGEVSGIRKGCVAAFGAPDPQLGTERLVVVAETREEARAARDRLAGAIMEAVATRLGVRPDEVRIVPARTVPKTSSGKLRRSACREAFLKGEIGRRHRAPWLQFVKLYASAWRANLRAGLGGLGRLASAAYVGLCVLITLLPAWLAMVLLPGGRPAELLSRWWARSFLWLAGYPLRLEGDPRLIETGPLILIANHSSYLDAVVLMAALPAGFLFTAKRELLSSPIIRTFIRKVGHLTLDRMDFSRSDEDTRSIEDALKRGRPVLIFPEGTFSRVRGLRPFRLGAFKIAAETSTPIFPLAIRGTREILWPGSWMPRRGTLKVTIGTPIRPQAGNWGAVIRLRDAAKLTIVRLSGETPLELASAQIPEE